MSMAHDVERIARAVARRAARSVGRPLRDALLPPAPSPRSTSPRRLIVGGGDHRYPDSWHNLEAPTEGYASRYPTLAQNTDIHFDLTTGAPLPLDDGGLECAYSSHVIEHLKDAHLEHLFRELHRASKPGATLRLSCPDIDLYRRAFFARDFEFFHYRGHAYYEDRGISDDLAGLFVDVFASRVSSGPHDPQALQRALEADFTGTLDAYAARAPYDAARSFEHVNWFNVDKLARMLTAAGWRDVTRSALGQSRHPAMRDLRYFDTGDPRISLFVEAVR